MGETSSIIKSKGGHPVVPSTSFSQPISAAESICTCVPVMSELIHVPNTFLALVTCRNLLCATGDRDVLMHTKWGRQSPWSSFSPCCDSTVSLCVRISQAVDGKC